MEITSETTVPGNGKIPEMPVDSQLVLMEALCTGITPLLFHRILPDTLEQIRDKEKKPKTAPPVGTPREECAPRVYQTEEGIPYVPREMLFACLVNAGKFVRLDGKRQVSTNDSTLLPAFLTLEGMMYPLLDSAQPDGYAKWEPDMRAGRSKSGDLIVVCRPRFDKWSFNVKFTVDTSEIDPKKMRDLFDIAGKRFGIGAFRPEKKGMFGQFRVDSWKKA